jgi:colicin import membrane protein
VDLLPTGQLAGVKLLKPSGLPGFDEAVRNAIYASEPFPKDKSGNVPRQVIIDHKLKEE